MPQKAVGLIGRGKGPLVKVVSEAAGIEVLGLDEGHEVSVEYFWPCGASRTQKVGLGRSVPIAGPSFVQISYEGPGSSLICNIHMVEA